MPKRRLSSLFQWPRPRHIIPDIILIICTTYLSLFLRVGVDRVPEFIDALHKFAPIILLSRISIFIASDSYSILWRYVSTFDVIKLTKATILSSTIIISLSFFLPESFGRIPKSLYLIETILTLVGLLGIRILRRVKFESRHSEQIRHGKRTLIYGAGYNGKTLADRFSYDVNEATLLVGFIDDDPKKMGSSIAGIKVLGNIQNLEELIKQYSITNLIIASTNMNADKIRKVLQITRPFNIRPRIITRTVTDETKKESQSVIDREINLSDLLNRPPRQVDIKAIREIVKGKRVLVTGAGGSIGSEISRQVLDNAPGRLILLDHSEFNLYQIDRELRICTTDLDRVTPLLLDLTDKNTLFNRLRELRPEVIIHAAAYKHVHLVESNPYSAILNNVLGLRNLLEFCEDSDVSNFVLISTDKAVNPAGVMGATKRVCEMMTAATGLKLNRPYCSVRFGNVLGSSGSLIPLLKEQIRQGGPVTITHKDMTRYFMLIPEAVSLVLKAATIARPGDICILKMGDPVKILEIAKNLITLTGHNEKDIGVVFTGLRPGEKIYEELYFRGDELKTEHPDILSLPNGDMENDEENIFQSVDHMLSLAMTSNKEALFILNDLVKSTYIAPESVKTESDQVNHLIGPNHKIH